MSAAVSRKEESKIETALVGSSDEGEHIVWCYVTSLLFTRIILFVGTVLSVVTDAMMDNFIYSIAVFESCCYMMVGMVIV